MSKAELQAQVEMMDKILTNYEGRLAALEEENKKLKERIELLENDTEEIRKEMNQHNKWGHQ